MARKRRAVIKQEQRTDNLCSCRQDQSSIHEDFRSKLIFNKNILIFIVILVLQLQNVIGEFIVYYYYFALENKIDLFSGSS